jgi:PIN domain nuclease of toxin-antitoxin system
VKILLDTCTFLWMIDQYENLSARAVELVRSPDNDLYLSAASAWEVGTKHAARRLSLSEPPDLYVPTQRDAHGILALPIDEESALHNARLPHLHRDPFDRMLVAQAIVHGMTIVTPDAIVRRYPARTTW